MAANRQACSSTMQGFKGIGLLLMLSSNRLKPFFQTTHILVKQI